MTIPFSLIFVMVITKLGLLIGLACNLTKNIVAKLFENTPFLTTAARVLLDPLKKSLQETSLCRK